MNKEKLQNFLEQYIKKEEAIGDNAGSSGHLSHTSFALEDYRITQEDKKYTIVFTYKIFIETEFTYYPDNPPQEYEYEKTIRINNNFDIVSEEEKISKGSDQTDITF